MQQKKFIMMHLMILLFLFQHASAGTITMGFFQHKPHQYVNKQGEVKGATVTYFEQIAAKMGYKVKWGGPLPFTRLLSYIKNTNALDGSPHLIKLPELEAIYYYADMHFHNAQSILVVKNSNRLRKITSIEQIKGYRIWYLDTNSPSRFIKENDSKIDMMLNTPNNKMWNQAINCLIHDRVDAVHDLNEFSVPLVAQEMGYGKHIKTLFLPEPPQPVYVGFSKRSKQGRQLLKKYNKAQAEWKFDNKDYEQLLQNLKAPEAKGK